MNVVFGTQVAKVGLRDLTSDDPDKVRYYRAPGNRETAFTIPEGMKTSEAFTAINIVLREQHMLRDAHLPGDEVAAPLWVESESPGLSALFSEEFGDIPTSRPTDWVADEHEHETEELDDTPVTVSVTHAEEVPSEN